MQHVPSAEDGTCLDGAGGGCRAPVPAPPPARMRPGDRQAHGAIAAAGPGPLWQQPQPDHIKAGIACFTRGEIAQAHQHFLAACHGQADDPEALRWLARSLRGLERTTDALAAWRVLLAHQPDDFEGLLRAGEAALSDVPQVSAGHAGRREAEAWLARAAALQPEDSRPVAVLAHHYVWTGQLREARRLVQLALVAQPRAVALWCLALQIVGACGREGLRARVLRRLQRAMTGTIADRLFLADVLMAAGAIRQARLLLEELAGRRLGHAGALERLGALALAQGELAEAQRHARRPGAPPGLADAVQACADYRRRCLSDSRVVDNRLVAASDDDWIGSFTTSLDRLRRRRRAASFTPRSGVVLHILNSLAAGGTERQCAQLAGEQARRDPDREIWVMRTDPRRGGRGAFFLDDLTRSGARSATLADFSAQAAGIRTHIGLLSEPPLPVRGLVNLHEIAGIAGAIAALRPEVVQAWTPQTAAHAAVAGLLMAVPRIILRGGSVAPAARNGGDEAEAHRIAVLRRLLRVALADRSTVLVNNTRHNLDDWLAWLGMDAGALADRAQVVPNILIHSQRSMPRGARRRADIGRDLRQRYGLSAGAFIVGGVMRLEREKDPDLWLATAAAVCRRHPAVYCVLVGDGRLRAHIAAEVQRHGLTGRVTLVGLVADELPDHFDLFDLLLLTSRFEGLPNVIIEAGAAGVPVVAADVGGVAEALARGRSGMLVAGRNADDFADAITGLIDDPSRGQAMGRAGRVFVKRFAPSAVLPLWDAVYRVPGDIDDQAVELASGFPVERRA